MPLMPGAYLRLLSKGNSHLFLSHPSSSGDNELQVSSECWYWEALEILKHTS